MSDNTMTAGLEATLWYKNHWEANLVMTGEGEVSDLTTGQSWPLKPGTLYVAGPPDRHLVRAIGDLHLISVFSPALQGGEVHDADGALAPSGPVPPGPKSL